MWWLEDRSEETEKYSTGRKYEKLKDAEGRIEWG